MISVITCTKREGFLEKIFYNFLSQKINPKELVIILHGENIAINPWLNKAAMHKNITVFSLSQDVSLGDCLNFAIEKCRYDYIAKFDDDDYYSPYYLLEVMKEVNIKNKTIFGKASIFIYFLYSNTLSLYNLGLENQYLQKKNKFLTGSTLVFPKVIGKEVKFPSLNLGEDIAFQKKCLEMGYSLYSTSIYNYTYLRYKNEHHTSDASNKKLLKHSKLIANTDNFHTIITLKK